MIERTNRPRLDISVNGFFGNAVADSRTQRSIAGNALYQLLKTTGHRFTKSHMILFYADGILRKEKILQTDIDVNIKQNVVSVGFTVLAETVNQFTLLWLDFLEKIVLNLPKRVL